MPNGRPAVACVGADERAAVEEFFDTLASFNLVISVKFKSDDDRMREDDPNPSNDITLLRSEVPGGGGVASARAIARLYELIALGGTVDGRRYFSEETAAQAATVLAEGIDLVLQKYWQRGLGFVVRLDPPASRHTIAVNHGGAGGSEHGAWPELGATYSNVMNHMRQSPATHGGPIVMDERAATLINALHSSVISLRNGS